jgi:hypothetical protein
MSDALATELQIRTTGTTEAVANLKQVAAASQTMTTQVNQSAEGFGHLEHVMFKMSGGNRELMMLFRGVSEASRVAGSDMGRFAGMMKETLVTGGLAAGAVASFKWLEHSIEDVNKQLEAGGYKAMGFWEMMGKSAFGGKPEVDEEATAGIRAKGEKSYVQKIIAEMNPEPLEGWAYRHAENYWQQHHVQIPARMLFADLEAQKKKLEEDAFWKKTGEAFRRALWTGKENTPEGKAMERIEALKEITTSGIYGGKEFANNRMSEWGATPEEQLARMKTYYEGVDAMEAQSAKEREDSEKGELDRVKMLTALRNAEIKSQAAGKGMSEAGAELQARQSGMFDDLGKTEEERKAMFSGMFEALQESAHEQVAQNRKQQDYINEDYQRPRFAGAAGMGSAEDYKSRIEAQIRPELRTPTSQDESVKRLEDIKNYNKIMAEGISKMTSSGTVQVVSIGNN